MLCLGAPQAQPIAAQLKFERITKRRRADPTNLDARRHAHLEQSPAHFIGSSDANHARRFAGRQVGC
jgi:hypothetical protein